MELGKGEALVSFLEGNGTPSMVERCMIRPPSARVGPISVEERKAIMAKSPVKGKYDRPIDRESAYEVLQNRTQSGAADQPPEPSEAGAPAQEPPRSRLQRVLDTILAIVATIFGTNRPRGTRLSAGQRTARQIARSVTNRVGADIGKSLGGKAGSSIGRTIARGTMGGILRR